MRVQWRLVRFDRRLSGRENPLASRRYARRSSLF